MWCKRYEGIPEWAASRDANRGRLALDGIASVDVGATEEWCREYLEELAMQAAWTVCKGLLGERAQHWRCCVLRTVNLPAKAGKLTRLGECMHQKGLFPAEQFSSCCPEDVVVGDEAELAHADGLCFSAVASFPLKALPGLLVQEVGLATRQEVFLSQREDTLSPGVAGFLAAMVKGKDEVGVARYLLRRGDMPVRYCSWDFDAEFSISWCAGSLEGRARS